MSNQIKGTVTKLGRTIPDTLTETANDPFKLALGLATGGTSVALDTAGKAMEPDAEVATPGAPPPPTLPTADSEAVRKAARRRVASLRNRGGRQSTILTGGDTFGG